MKRKIPILSRGICARKNQQTERFYSELLESRILLSAAESATAQLNLVSTTGTVANPVYNYDINLTNTGTGNLGTFWFAWVPGEDFLPSVPLTESSPAGWGSADGTSSTPIITGEHSSTNGSAIQWVAQSPAAILAPGHSLNGFTFSTTDSPAALAGQSPTHPESATLTSFVYTGAPLTDAGFQFVAADATVATGTAGSTTTLATSVASVPAGSPVTFTATVAPTASGATPTGTVTFKNGATSLGTANVGSDGTASLVTSSLPAGVDSISAVYGGDATYATSTSTALSETVQAAPALAVSALKSTLPLSVVSGQPARGVITVNLTNQSGAAIKGKGLVEVFASTDGTIDASDALVAKLTPSLNLKVRGSTKETLSVKSLPTGLATGSYTLLARVVGPDAIQSDASTGPALQVAAPVFALSETFSKLTLPATAAAGSKVRATATLRITNSGNVTDSTISVGVFASLTGPEDKSATAIDRLAKKLKIAPGKSLLVTVPLTTLPALSAGTYFVFAGVTDQNGQLFTADSGKMIAVT